MSPPNFGVHSLSWNWKELVLHRLMSELIIVRSVKVTFPAASMRMIVLVLRIEPVKSFFVIDDHTSPLEEGMG